MVSATKTTPRLSRKACRSGGRLFSYGEVCPADRCEAGTETEPLVVLVHGWGLAHSSYRRAAEALGARGCHVVVPDLPGFGWTTDLPLTRVTFERFAEALEGYLRTVLDRTGEGLKPVHLVGHSFGGAVAVQLAHDAPDIVASVSLVSAASGVTWSRDEKTERLLSERPLWDWAFHLLTEFPLKEFPVAATPVFRDLGHNLLWHFPSLGLVAHITRQCDLRSELAAVVASGIPVHVIRGSRDEVVTQACFDDQCQAAGCAGTVVEGNHGWPLTDPEDFARVISELASS